MFVSVSTKNTSIKKCAFCKNWYDPTNSAIRPKFTNVGLWEYDKSQKAKCLIDNMEHPSFSFCRKFECKV